MVRADDQRLDLRLACRLGRALVAVEPVATRAPCPRPARRRAARRRGGAPPSRASRAPARRRDRARPPRPPGRGSASNRDRSPSPTRITRRSPHVRDRQVLERAGRLAAVEQRLQQPAVRRRGRPARRRTPRSRPCRPGSTSRLPSSRTPCTRQTLPTSGTTAAGARNGHATRLTTTIRTPLHSNIGALPPMPKTVILSAARTPIGKLGGGARLASTRPSSAATAIKAALERAEVAPEQVQHVVMGQVLQAGQGQIPSRQAQIKAGIPKEVSSETINKVCASGHPRRRAARRRDPRRRPRGRRRRRDGVDVERALPAQAGPVRLPDGGRQGDRRDDQRRPDQPVLAASTWRRRRARWRPSSR